MMKLKRKFPFRRKMCIIKVAAYKKNGIIELEYPVPRTEYKRAGCE